MYHIYLAGPMSICSREEANAWRDEFADRLGWNGITILSPMRNPERHQTDKEIMSRDRWDVFHSDLVVMDLRNPKVSIGTMIEVWWADAKRIPIIAIVGDDNPHIIHPMLSEAIAYRVHDVAEAVQLVRSILV